MGNFNLFSFKFIDNTPVSENQPHIPVLVNFHPGWKVMNTKYPKKTHFYTLIKTLVFLMITSCINEMNYEGDMLTMINTARTTGYICQGKKHKPVGKMSWDSQLEKAALIHSNYMDSVGELNHKWKDGTQ